MLGGNDMKSDIEADDMRVLRKLANKGAEISHADERARRRELWRAVNNRKLLGVRDQCG
jgi:hypothetical protein